jgi:hypothetical protein
MSEETDSGRLTFVVPAHTLTGNVEQLLAEIDDTIGALEMIRAEIVARAPKPAKPPRHPWWKRLAELFGPAAVTTDGRRSGSQSMAR